MTVWPLVLLVLAPVPYLVALLFPESADARLKRMPVVFNSGLLALASSARRSRIMRRARCASGSGAVTGA